VTDDSDSPIKIAIQNLKARRPKPRGRRQELAAYADELRNLLAEGWSRVEIIGEIQAQGGKISPALLRDVLQVDRVKPQLAKRPKQIKRKNEASPLPPATRSPTSPSDDQQAAATAPHDQDQSASLVEPVYNGHRIDDAE